MKVDLTINGRPRTLAVQPGEVLVDTLRGAGYHGVKEGCREGTCGCCTVLLDGTPVYSCLVFSAQVDGAAITTIEGLGTPSDPHPLQAAFAEAGAVQCGYCAPATILVAKALLDAGPDPSEEEVKQALDGNLCRCTGHVKRLEAVMRAARIMREEGHGA